VCLFAEGEISEKNYFKSRAFKVFIPPLIKCVKEGGFNAHKEENIVTSSYRSQSEFSVN
jgi:hypothetical protein